MLIQLCAGVIYMWSVFNTDVAEFLQWDQSAAVMTASIMLAMFVVGILVGGRAHDRFGTKIVCIVGSLMMSSGILLTAFVPSTMPELVYLTYGVLGGFGVGTVYTCTISSIQKWFFDRRGFATGMMVGSFGFSLVLFSPIADYMLSAVGVASTFMIFGIGFMIVCVTASFLITNPPKEYCVAGSSKTISSSQKQYTAKEVLRTKSFYCIVISLFLVLSVFFILNPQLKTLGMDRGLTPEMAIGGVMLVGVCSTAGRFVLTVISDKLGRSETVLLSIGLTALGAAIMIFAYGVVFLASLAIIAFAFGGIAGLYTTLTADHFGTVNMGSNYGLVMIGFGASALFFPYLSTVLTKDTGDYTVTFAICFAACVIATILVLVLRTQKDQ